MYAISLTSIPPRLARLGPVLESLRAQEPAPAAIFLCLPRRYRRYRRMGNLPTFPSGVSVLWSETDFGPATKALVAARHLRGSGMRLLYCDDDWIHPRHWAAALLSGDAGSATSGQTWDIDRIGRVGTGCDVAQGFAGVSVAPRWLAGAECNPPDAAWPVDDIWLSGQFARQGIAVSKAPAARRGMVPAYDDAHALQAGPRDAQNRACALVLHDRYGVWPARS
ncbi:hypothetical protein [Roseovarius aestuariivivens]|uniref:hypothetical protein n=1 Tax=Roseovarius aestuariivivens TaxID=1888910 RepID=UPI001080B658|nr:hypothetical protein [Roseovarius aestuariivivens]